MNRTLEQALARDLRLRLDREMDRLFVDGGIYTTSTNAPKEPPATLTVEGLCSSVLSALTGKAWRVNKYIPATSKFDDGSEHEVVWRFEAGCMWDVPEETYTCNTEVGLKLIRLMRVPQEIVKDAGT